MQQVTYTLTENSRRSFSSWPEGVYGRKENIIEIVSISKPADVKDRMGLIREQASNPTECLPSGHQPKKILGML